MSRRAVTLHVSVLLWIPMCLVAGWWQVTRALDGNGLSYLYSVEWPIFAIVGVLAWWSLVHTDPETVGARAQRRMRAAGEDGREAVPAGQAAAAAASGRRAAVPAGGGPGVPRRRREEEDDELAAYNDRLAALAMAGRPKTWRRS